MLSRSIDRRSRERFANADFYGVTVIVRVTVALIDGVGDPSSVAMIEKVLVVAFAAEPVDMNFT